MRKPVGIFKSTGGGTSWNYIGSFGSRTLAIDPLNPNIIYAESYDLFKSIDGGTTWSSCLNGYRTDTLAINPVNPNIICAGTESRFHRHFALCAMRFSEVGGEEDGHKDQEPGFP